MYLFSRYSAMLLKVVNKNREEEGFLFKLKNRDKLSTLPPSQLLLGNLIIAQDAEEGNTAHTQRWPPHQRNC